MVEKKAFWKSRGFWGPVAAVVAMLLQQAGLGELDQGALVDYALSTVEVVGVILGFIGRLRATKRLGLADRAAPDLDFDVDNGVVERPAPERAARLQATWPAVLAALALALLLGACAAGPQARFAQGQTLYNDVLDAAIAARAPCVDTAKYPGAGPEHPLCRLDDAAYRRFEAARARAGRLLDDARAAMEAGNEAGSEVYLDHLEGALQDLLLFELTRTGS